MTSGKCHYVIHIRQGAPPTDDRRNTLTGLGGEDERRVSVIVGQVGIDIVRYAGQQLEYRHEPASAGVTQPRLRHTPHQSVCF